MHDRFQTAQARHVVCTYRPSPTAGTGRLQPPAQAVPNRRLGPARAAHVEIAPKLPVWFFVCLQVDTTFVQYDRIPPHVVDALVEQGDVMHCAGALMVENELTRPYLRGITNGGEDAVMGLSKETVAVLLNQAVEAPHIG